MAHRLSRTTRVRNVRVGQATRLVQACPPGSKYDSKTGMCQKKAEVGWWYPYGSRPVLKKKED